MRILAFPGRLAAKAKAPVRDWSTQEIADFYRAHRLLAENGAGIGIDRGLSDEGEPWMVFFDVVSQDVFLHIARIDGTCKLICEPFNMRLDAADIASLIAQFEHAVTDYLAIRTERAKNVVIHPAARIIMSISAVFLLFKLENGEAYAKGLSDKAVAPATDRATEKSMTALARAQSAFQRAFDAFEPAHAALIAGLILAGELAMQPFSSGEQGEVLPVLSAFVPAHHVTAAVFSADTVEIAAVPPVAAVAPTLAAPLPTAPIAQLVAIAVSAVTFTPAETVVQVPAAAPLLDFRAPPVNPVLAASPAATVEKDAVVADSDAGKVLDYLLTLAQDRARPSSPAEEAPVVAPDKLGDVSLDNLASLDGTLAFSADVTLSVVDLIALTDYLYKHMPDFEFGFDSGRVLVEQADIAGLEKSEVATLVSHMGDGGTYTIIGRADLISDALALFA